MRGKSLGILLLASGLLGVAALTLSEQGSAADGNCYASAVGPSTPTICN